MLFDVVRPVQMNYLKTNDDAVVFQTEGAQTASQAAQDKFKNLIITIVAAALLAAVIAATMNEVVDSGKRVTDIMGEISSASKEQSDTVGQIGEAVTQMDQATQQIAALAEEMAAPASSLSTQATDVVQSVAVFRHPGNPVGLSAVTPVVRTRAPVMKPKSRHRRRRT